MVFGLGLLIYMSVLLYGQFVLGAVIEEKETRIAEILFSSMRSFPLMMGKLIGVSLVALTQLGIWAVAFLSFSAWLAGSSFTLPNIPPLVFVYFVLFFLMGYFIYATFYAVVGSMVTTTQEGGQLALPIVLMLVMGFICRSMLSQPEFVARVLGFNVSSSHRSQCWCELSLRRRHLADSAQPGNRSCYSCGLMWVARESIAGMLIRQEGHHPEVLRWIGQA